MAGFLHHRMNREQRRCHIRQLTRGGDQIGPLEREWMPHEQMTDLRDTAWTARDLVSMSEPGPREAFWWEERWPWTTWSGWRDPSSGTLPLDFSEETA